jgi:hypothetical protein
VIGWQNPIAFWALSILALPIVIHLLRRHRANRVPFPSLRFVRSAQTSVARLGRPSDLLVLAIRVAVLALAVSAIARPVLLTKSRLVGWNASTARAVVVDTSASMRAAGRPDRGVQAAEAAAAELATATYGRRFDVPVLADGLARAAAWLSSTPPSRKEIVVISDGQRGAIVPSSIASVHETIGLRFAIVGEGIADRTFEGAPLLDASGAADGTQMLEVTADATAVTIEKRAASGRAGIRIVPETEVEPLLRIAARAGAFAGSADEPVTFRFPAAEPSANSSAVSPVRAGWMLRRVLRVEEAFSSASAGALVSQSPAALKDRSASPWTIVLANPSGAPILTAAAVGNELIFDVGAPADSLLAAAIVRAVLNARVAPADYDEREVARITGDQLNKWTRAPRPADLGAWRQADVTDARWCWALALLLLVVEQWLRARSRAIVNREVARAA